MTCIQDERVGYLLDPLAFEVFDEEVFPDGQVDEVVVCESGSQHSEGPVEGASLEDPEAGVPLLLPLQSSSYVTTISDSAPVCPPQLRQTIFVRRLLAAAVI